MSYPYQVLDDVQVEHFLNRGYVKLEGCFPKEKAQAWIDLAYRRLGYDPEDPETWEEARIHLPGMNSEPIATFSPKAWGAICDLLGGEDRIEGTPAWRDGFIINFKIGADRPWEGPSPGVKGWHKDGDFFRHFLDSPEQGLLTVILWSDVLPRSGGTFLATDSVAPIARYLVEHPEGLVPREAEFGKRVEGCREFAEATGEAGDVFLIHPYTLHSASQNPSGRARFITNPPVRLKEPMDFNREDPEHFSLVERGVLQALGVDRLDFRPAGPRERIVPERVRRQEKMLEEQKARLGIA